jgi:hypothetical protein
LRQEISLACEGANTMTDWQPIETAPRDGMEIIGVMKSYHPSYGIPFSPTLTWFLGDKWRYYDRVLEEVDWYEPTHWRPLPQPPKEGET